MNIPIFEFDPVQAIALKAKMFFYDRAISLGDYLYHRDRPLHIPLSMTWIALNLGRWDEQGVKIIFPLFFLAFCVIYFVFLKNRMNARWALVGLFLLLSSLYFIFHASSPYMDLPLMVYAMGAVFLILDWQEKREQGLLWLAGILAGIAAFTKREGAAFLIVFFFMLVKMVLEEKSSPGKKIRRVAPFFIPAFFFPALFGIFIRQTGVEVLSETAWKIGRDNFCSLPALIGRFLAELFFSGNWHLMWFVLIMSLLYFRGFRKTKTVEYLLMVLGLFLGFYFIVSFATTASPWVLKTDVVLSRLFLHFYPLVPAIIVLLHYSARNRPSDLQ